MISLAESIREEVKGMYAKKREDLKKRADSIRKDIGVMIDRNKNESYKEVESK